MATGPTIVAKFTADATALSKEVDSASSKASSSMSSFGKKAALAIGGAFAVGKIVDFGKASVSAAMADAEAQAKLATTLQNVTGATDAQIAATEDYISNLSKQTAIADDDLRPALDNLVRGFGDVESAQQALALATDVSAGTGKDLTTVTEAMMKAANGQTGALGRLGIATKNADGSAKSLDEIMASMSETFGGQAATAADTTAGRMRNAQIQFGEFQEQLGTALLPLISSFADILMRYVIPALTKVATFVQENIRWIGPLAVALGVATVAIWAMNAALAANPISLIIIAVAALVAGIIALYQNCEVFRTVVDAAFKAVATAFGWITDAAKAVFSWIQDNWPLLLAILTGPIGAAVILIVKNWDTVKDAATAVFDWVKGKWDAIAAAIAWAVGLIQAYISTLISAWGTAKDAATAVWSWVTDKWNLITSGISSAVGLIQGYMASIVTALKTPIAAATEVYDWVKEKFEALVDVIEGVLGGVTTAATSIASAIKAPINAVIDGINAIQIPSITIGGFDIPGPGPNIPSFTTPTIDPFPHIPRLATGGVLDTATLFIGGEAGREIVTPEALMRQIVAEEAGGGDTYVLNLYPRTADASDVAYGFRRLELLAGVG